MKLAVKMEPAESKRTLPKWKTPLLASFVSLFAISCPEEIPNPFAKPTPVDPCDPSAEVYIDGKHFIERDSVDPEGNIDFEHYYKSLEPGNSPCDPLKEGRKSEPGDARPETEDLRLIPPNSGRTNR